MNTPEAGKNWEVIAIATDSIPEVGTGGPVKKAQGVYLVVVLSIKNLGSSPTSFPFGDLRIKDDAGRSHIFDDEATFTHSVREFDVVHVEAFNPGVPYVLGVVFDVPVDAKGFALTTSASVFTITLDR